MRRGDVVTVIAPGDYGKARPAVVVQSDHLEGTASVIVCLITTFERDAPLFRLGVVARPDNGLRQNSQIMVDKLMTVERARVGRPMGRLDRGTIAVLSQMLAACLGLAENPA